jgi:Tol biopolymer transport system component
MKSLWISLILVATFLVAGNLAVSAQTPEQLYQKGLMKEEGEGALQDAIALYNQVADNSNADQSLRAKALLHIGLCYEKMGTQEAVRAYQRLVNAFPAQTNEVAIARERLNRLLLTAENTPQKIPVPKFTKIKIPSEPWYSTRLSPDGEMIALVSDNKLWMMPVSGNVGPDIPGQPVQLNTNGIQPEWTSGLSWSGDGKWIAFNELPDENRPAEVRWNQSIYVVSVTGGHPKKVVENFRDFTNRNYTISLSPNGETLAHTAVLDKKQFLYTTPINGGVQRKLVGIQAREPAYSPDGKWIAFLEDRISGHDGGNLCIVPSSGGDPTTLVELNHASSPVWSPDGKTIAFIDEEESKKIKFVQVQQNGKRIGNVSSVQIPEGMEKVDLLTGWGTNNKLSVLLSTDQEYSIYTLPAKGGQVSMLLNDCLALQPRWLAARDEIIFITTEQDQPFIPPALVFATVPSKGGSVKILNMEHNNEKVIPGPPELGGRISPDGRSFIFSGWTMSDTTHDLREQTTSIWSYSFDDQSTKRLTNENRLFVDRYPSWSPDGRKIAFIRYHVPQGSLFNWDTTKTRIYTMNSSGGDLQLLYADNDANPASPAWSPDGNMISFITRMEDKDKWRLNVINVEDGKTRVVCEIPEFNSTMDPCWSPDSKNIAYNDGMVIKVANVDNGTVEDIQTNLKSGVNIIYYLDWSPDGERFVFGGANQGESEFWFLEDFLPLDLLPDQSGPALAAEPEGIRIRKVWESSYLEDLGRVSYDGRFRSCVDWGVGDLAIHDLKSGRISQLTHTASLGDSGSFVLNTAISKNGKQIVSTWWRPYNTTDLVLYDVENSTSKMLYSKHGEEVYPYSWLSDHEFIGLRLIPEGRTLQIVSYHIPDKSLQVRKSFNKIQGIHLTCSPDEKYIAYDFDSGDDSENLDINILSVEGNGDIPLINHPANDRVFGWVPGSKEFLFLSDRSGNWDLWAVTLDENQVAGPARRIYADIGEVEPMGFTQNGDCYFGFSKRNFYTSITPFNPISGEVELGSGKSLKGSNFGVIWSPDGLNLAYIRIDDGNANHPVQFIVQDLETGSEVKPLSDTFYPGTYSWSPDGKSILVVGRDRKKLQTEGYLGEFFLMDIETGQTDQVLQLSDYEFNVAEDDAAPLSRLEWSPDGRSFYFLFFKDRLMKHNLDSGEDKILFRYPNFTYGVLDLSPDGKSLLIGLEYPGDEKSRLFTLPVEGGQEKEVCTSQEAKRFNKAFWSPDGQYIYFSEILEGMKTSLWRIPSTGGTPEKVWNSENQVEIFDIHPDGNQIAFSIRERKTEVRVIENLSSEIARVFNE